MTNYNNIPTNNVVGNNYKSDNSLGFKSEVKHAFESYQQRGINLTNAFMSILTSPENREEFIGNVIESLTTSPVFTEKNCANEAFYDNYTERVEQLIDNSMKSVATESAMLGYAPIVAYTPFFLKKQWINCIFKDVLMTEVPQSTVINLAFEKRFLKSMDGTLYPIPDVFYDDEIMSKLYAESTGNEIKHDPIAISLFKSGLKVLTPTYIEGILADDPTVELTHDIKVSSVFVQDSESKEYEVPMDMRIDITTHNFVNGTVKYDVKDSDGSVKESITDTLHGSVDFQRGVVTILSSTDAVTKIVLSGKIANRWNKRSLDVERKVEQIQHLMPESGPRLNSAITVEDAADALILQKIDQVADNVDVMGSTLANLEDFDIRQFLLNSFETQKKVSNGPHGYDKMIVEGEFDTLPYDSYSVNITTWIQDSKEYFERIIEALKDILKSEDVIICCVAHPSLVRFLQNGIKWVFSDETNISGMKLDYNFGVYTTAGDKVHIITTRYMKAEDGLRFILIPTTNELITFKHYKYNCIIDRNYRNPLYTLTPNIMATHRTLTFEVLPVQGKMTIKGRDLFSPTTLKRTPTP